MRHIHQRIGATVQAETRRANRAADNKVVGVERDVTHKRVHRRPEAKMKQLTELPAREQGTLGMPADDELSAGVQKHLDEATPYQAPHTKPKEGPRD